MTETDRDPTDTNFMVFLIVAFLFILGLAITIFPQLETTEIPSSTSGTSAPAKK